MSKKAATSTFRKPASPRIFQTWVARVGFVIAGCFPVVALGHGAIDERIAELKAELVKTPDDAMTHYMLADAHVQHEDWVAAMRSLARAEELAPGKFPTDLVRAQVNLGAGRPEEARLALDRLLAQLPGNVRALALRARAFALLKDDERCVADFRAALEGASAPELDLIEEASSALAARGFQDEAAQVLSAGIARVGPVPSLVLKALDLEFATGRLEAALARVEAMQKAAPRPEPWMARRAALLEQAGRKEEARTAWQALDARLTALPPLERGSQPIASLAGEVRRALGQGTRPAPVVAPPAPKISTVSTPNP